MKDQHNAVPMEYTERRKFLRLVNALKDAKTDGYTKARDKLLAEVEVQKRRAYGRGKLVGHVAGYTASTEDQIKRDKTRNAPADKWDGWGEPQQVPPDDD